MITQFFDSGGVSAHEKFQAWRTNHQEGVFLTLETQTRGNLHGARCGHLGSGPPYFALEDYNTSLTSKRKICGSEEDLWAWAAANGVSVTRCRHCVRDGLIGGGETDQVIEQIRLAEEVPAGSTYGEGSVERILINRYERDPRAREDCIKHYGAKCVLCGFDFVTVYGEVMARRGINVHHLNQLSSVGADYQVDPIQDLRPVCPNCHAVLHRREPPHSLEDVRGFLKARRGR
jgi:predicted HNH restriction endonuclease